MTPELVVVPCRVIQVDELDSYPSFDEFDTHTRYLRGGGVRSPRKPHKLETVGSNPTRASIYIRRQGCLQKLATWEILAHMMKLIKNCRA